MLKASGGFFFGYKEVARAESATSSNQEIDKKTKVGIETGETGIEAWPARKHADDHLTAEVLIKLYATTTNHKYRIVANSLIRIAVKFL